MQVLEAYSEELQKKFLLFTTGSDRVPVGGTSDMTIKITRMHRDKTDRLPVAHTCFNQVDAGFSCVLVRFGEYYSQIHATSIHRVSVIWSSDIWSFWLYLGYMVNGQSDFSTKFFRYMVILAIWSTLSG